MNIRYYEQIPPVTIDRVRNFHSISNAYLHVFTRIYLALPADLGQL